ncbi:unnamed protein product [Cyprideis torosa]|uniref:Uncharacterized protein n=1 Tax=Cyprideis torosa TaxID=163714 RepID=A0A7R9A013_9CRUS|nr:unnamed protein product [Cyprideis torosa]CAG0910329.1 unnamed protein product [Cyprideis torosa]
MFSSNNTSQEEFALAMKDGGAIVNLDDISFLAKLDSFPELLSFRYNPGAERSGNAIIGCPQEAKYGVDQANIEKAYALAKEHGVKKFGLHTMLASNELDYTYMVQTTKMLLDLVKRMGDNLGMVFDFINIGGGLGIPYRPEDQEFDLEKMGKEITLLFRDLNKSIGYSPKLYMESGRFMTGPHGVLVTRAINRKEIYRTYIGVDACMTALMRPGMYGAYHHIDVLGKDGTMEQEKVDVVGSLCENNDKFAIQRLLPVIEDGDILIIQDTGAHGHSMGFNYNGKLRPQELLLRENGVVERIRRAETVEDYFATLNYAPKALSLAH